MNLHTTINANGLTNRKDFSLNLWILNNWKNDQLELKSIYKNLATFKARICLTLTMGVKIIN